MTQTSYPFDGQTVTESQFSAFFRELSNSGVCDGPSGTSLKASATGTNMIVSVQPGFAIVRGFAYNSTAVEPLTIAAAHASLARVDRIVLRADPSVNSVVLAVITGTPGAGAPALTQTDTGIYETPLANVAIPAGATVIQVAGVTDTRDFNGTRVQSWLSSTTRPANPRKGMIGFDNSNGLFYYYDGTAWQTLLNWNNISGKPSSFTPAAHVHAYAPDLAPLIQAGSDIVVMSASSIGSVTITYPTSFAPYTPVVQVTKATGSGAGSTLIPTVTSASSTGCTITLISATGASVTGNIAISWLAVVPV